MSKKLCSHVNAACEGLFGRLESTFVYPRNWQYIDLDELMCQIPASSEYELLRNVRFWP